MAIAAAKGKLIAVIGDEDTCVGFLLGGIGEMNQYRRPNFLVVDKMSIDSLHVFFHQYLSTLPHAKFFGFKATPLHDIEDSFQCFVSRNDIDIILINQVIADQIRHVIDLHNSPIPAVLEIPSKDSPYDPNKDSILRRAQGMFNPEDFR